MADPIESMVPANQQDSNVPGGTVGAGSVPSGTPAAGSGDATELSREQLLIKLNQLDEDRKRVQAIKDREVAEERKRVQALSDQLAEMKKQGMTEQERIAFENEQLKRELDELRGQQQRQTEMDQYAAYLRDRIGIDPNKLDRSNPEALTTSAWAAIEELVTSLKSNTPTAPAAPQPPQNNSKVVTGQGGVPKVKSSMKDMMEAMGVKTVDEFFRRMEHDPDRMNQWLQE